MRFSVDCPHILTDFVSHRSDRDQLLNALGWGSTQRAGVDDDRSSERSSSGSSTHTSHDYTGGNYPLELCDREEYPWTPQDIVSAKA